MQLCLIRNNMRERERERERGVAAYRSVFFFGKTRGATCESVF